ncbi:ORF155 [Leucania separata nucleopolyhedrovirus]|uniref:ORF155 n=1 Tax=Leucania separata nucleopolyhedrovirus TaxID=1307956 RepID=Q0IKW4_NPVLS|nr:ORF155 [Leucania separata nucleopolyhedrovirus]AAR28919.1 ORF155 [Leucania separata nucleopolyhedrovirus]
MASGDKLYQLDDPVAQQRRRRVGYLMMWKCYQFFNPMFFCIGAKHGDDSVTFDLSIELDSLTLEESMQYLMYQSVPCISEYEGMVSSNASRSYFRSFLTLPDKLVSLRHLSAFIDGHVDACDEMKDSCYNRLVYDLDVVDVSRIVFGDVCEITNVAQHCLADERVRKLLAACVLVEILVACHRLRSVSLREYHDEHDDRDRLHIVRFVTVKVLAQILLGIVVCRPLALRSSIEDAMIGLCKRILDENYFPDHDEDYEGDYEVCRAQFNELFDGRTVVDAKNFNSQRIDSNEICYTYKSNEAVIYRAQFLRQLFEAMKIECDAPICEDSVMNVFVVFAKPFRMEPIVLDEYVVVEDETYR